MKRAFFGLLSVAYLLVSLPSCKKDSTSDATGADILLQGSGFLYTIGGGPGGAQDTLTYLWPNPMGGEMYGYLFGGQTPAQHITFAKTGDNTVAIKRSVPFLAANGKTFTYLGTQLNNPSYTGFPNDYIINHYESQSAETNFIVKRSKININNFTIESYAHPGNYLSVASWSGGTVAWEYNLVFNVAPREFFFMQK